MDGTVLELFLFATFVGGLIFGVVGSVRNIDRVEPGGDREETPDDEYGRQVRECREMLSNLPGWRGRLVRSALRWL